MGLMQFEEMGVTARHVHAQLTEIQQCAACIELKFGEGGGSRYKFSSTQPKEVALRACAYPAHRSSKNKIKLNLHG